VRHRAATARSVSGGEDLDARLAVSGTDEVAELTVSFNQMLDNLQRAFDSQRRFLDGAAHELRAPLTVVRGHVELLDDDDPAGWEADVALVLEEVDRMDRLVDDLRVLARSERPDFLEPAPTDVRELVSSIGRKAAAMGDRRWVVVDDVDGVVRADGQRLTQAVLALVDNALHVTTEADTVEIGGTVRADDLVLWVRDTGPGIAEDDLPTLFDREGRTVERRPGGTGLGLPIVAAIARAHHGSVSATSTLGEGARIEITLPRSAP
jgi:signal transduction histidine kinase